MYELFRQHRISAKTFTSFEMDVFLEMVPDVNKFNKLNSELESINKEITFFINLFPGVGKVYGAKPLKHFIYLNKVQTYELQTF